MQKYHLGPATLAPMIPAVNFELVVAHCSESLLWLKRVPPTFRRTVYAKGPHSLPQSLPLPNVGREAHTYLHHILQRYDSLASVTVFCQGHPFDHASDFHHRLRGLADGKETLAGFRWFGFIIDSDDPRGRRLFVNWSKNPDHRELPGDVLYRDLFEGEPPALFRFYPGAQFAVTRERILSRPRSFYEKALALSLEIENAAHVFERIWDHIFGCIGVDATLLQGRDCLYLKPIRRLL